MIRAKRGRKQKTDREDARHILKLLLKDDFPRIWVPSWENRDLRQLLWHRHPMVQVRTRVMNQLQAVALNEGLRCKKWLWRQGGRQKLESFELAPWASRRRRELLELLDRLNPAIAELNQAVEQEADKCPQAKRLITHPGVGHRERGTLWLRQSSGELSRTGAAGRIEWESSTTGTHHRRGTFDRPFLARGSGAITARVLPEWRSKYVHLMMRRGRKTAKVAMARKLAVHLYWMWHKGWDYEQWKKFGSHVGQPGHRDSVL